MIVPGTPAPADNNAAVDGRELARFQRRLNLLAATLIVLVALVYLLQTFAAVLQQLFVASGNRSTKGSVMSVNILGRRKYGDIRA